MKYLNAEVFKESSKRNKKLLIIGIILLGITILLIYLGIKNENKALPKEIDLNTLVEKENDEEYVYLRFMKQMVWKILLNFTL